MADAPAFDPDKPFDPVVAPAFDASKPFEPVKADQDVGQLRAAGEGFLSGASAGWRDEIYGASKASGAPEFLGGFRAPIGAARLAYEHFTGEPGEASKAYDDAVAHIRDIQQRAQKQYPATYTGANVIGTGTSMLAAPMGQAATLPARMVQGAKLGAGYGALAGAGEGEGLAGTATGALAGGTTGALVGAAATPLAEGLTNAAGALGSKAANAIRGVVNPEGEASRRILVAAKRDLETSGRKLSPEEITAANDADIPRALIDAGGETTRALARSAANTSPEARSALSSFVNDRFENQAPRAAGFIDNLVGGAGDVGTTREALKDAARRANKPAYDAAYQDGDRGIWSPELERLTGSPAVVEAMKDAAQNGKTRAIADGFGAFNPGVTVTNDGQLIFNKGKTGVPTYPNLQFWDYTYRALRDAGQQSMQSGRGSEGAAVTAVASQLRNELDKAVPQFQKAREGAARFFGASDALEAGQTFATSKMANSEAQKAVSAMNPAERQLFMKGYASQLLNRINETGDNRNIANVFGSSPSDRQRAVIALGPQRANQLEAYVRAERILDTARGAVTGNSTTARQLTELGLAGGAGAGAGYGSHGSMTGSAPADAVLAGALAYGAMRGKSAINERLAKQVGQMLVSDDPAVLSKGFNLLTRNGSFLNALRAFDTASATAVGTRQATKLLPSIQGTVPAVAEQNQGQ